MSFLRRYVHLFFSNASPSLQLSGAFGGPPCFCSLPHLKQGVDLFWVFFFFTLSSPSTHWNLFVCSVFRGGGLSMLCYLCGWLTGGHRVHAPPPPTPPCLGLGSWCFVTTLTNGVGLSSLCAVVATHFDLVCCCFFFSVFFWKLQFSFFRRAAGTTKGIFARRSKLMASQSDLLASFVFWCPAAGGKGEHCTFFYNVALFSSSCSMDVKMSLAWCWAGADWTRTRICTSNLGLGAENDYF